jgi:hypothetical protein
VSSLGDFGGLASMAPLRFWGISVVWRQWHPSVFGGFRWFGVNGTPPFLGDFGDLASMAPLRFWGRFVHFVFTKNKEIK